MEECAGFNEGLSGVQSSRASRPVDCFHGIFKGKREVRQGKCKEERIEVGTTQQRILLEIPLTNGRQWNSQLQDSVA